jgi:hypothetical protein
MISLTLADHLLIHTTPLLCKAQQPLLQLLSLKPRGRDGLTWSIMHQIM